MYFHVFDTYVKSKDGHIMHFDVITDKKENNKAIQYAKEWLKAIGENDQLSHQKNANSVTLNQFQKKQRSRL